MNKVKTDYIDPTFAYSVMHLAEKLAEKSYSKRTNLTIVSEGDGWVETIPVLYRGEDKACLWGDSEVYRTVVKVNLINTAAYPLKFISTILSDKMIVVQKSEVLTLMPYTQIRMYSAIQYGLIKQLTAEESFRYMNSFNYNEETKELNSLNPILQYLAQT